MNSITDSTYTTQEKLQILADAAKYDCLKRFKRFAASVTA